MADVDSESNQPPGAAAGASFFRTRSGGSGDGPAELGAVTPTAGMRVGSFRLRSFLARGGMGQVWVAEDLDLGREVALKLILPELVDERGLAYFEREARAGGRLQHPGIVTTLGTGIDDGLTWIAQELIEGSWTLKDFLDELRSVDRVPDGYYRSVAELAAQLAEALEAAHAAGVIHRDVKPANVLIAPDDTPRLTDFGLARITDDPALSMTGDVLGTWWYMSPEQVNARASALDHRTDVFSLGVVLYELLTLRRPFDGDTTHQIAAQILEQDPPDPASIRSQCPRELAVICGKALEKEPARRYATAGELAADLRRHLAHEPIHARPPSLATRASKWLRRNPTLGTAGAIGTLALVVISILLAQNLRANASLAEQTRVAEQERADVLRLSAQADVAALIEEARVLWPPHQARMQDLSDWIGRAEGLIGDLPRHRELREGLRADALPRSEDQRAAEREAHPSFGRLAELERHIDSRARALAVRRGEAEPEVPEIDVLDYGETSAWWNENAWDRVAPERTLFGEEAIGIALARGVLADGEPWQIDEAHDSLAWGWFALGDDEAALEASRRALAAADEGHEAEFEGYLQAVTEAVERARSAEGLAEAEDELARLRAEYAELDAQIDQRVTWTYPEGFEQQAWWDSQLTELIDGLELIERVLLDPEGISVEFGWSVARRSRFAQRLAVDLISHRHYHDAPYLHTIKSEYPGFSLPQGLAPIGQDPESGLWEFVHEASGDPPVRGDDGRLVLEESTGIVLVLLPGGTFWMGSQDEDPAERQYVADVNANESPVHEVTVSPFLISKYELTQGQWLRLAGENPAYYQDQVIAATLLHPVEQVTWQRSLEVCERFGLTLPSEAQWEYAARAGSETPWAFGPEREDLRGRVNLADGSAREGGANWGAIDDWPDHEDGGVVHREVGSYPANAFGLHEMHGNVAEWCADGYDFYAYRQERGPDPVTGRMDPDFRIHRGGSFRSDAHGVRSSNRSNQTPDAIQTSLGLRPVLRLR